MTASLPQLQPMGKFNDYQVATKGEMGEISSFLGRLPPLSAVGAAQF
jgi:hypothetical protein